MITTYRYGDPPKPEGIYTFDWQEYMHYLYLPVMMYGELYGRLDIRLPERLEFLRPILEDVVDREDQHQYIYVTARRGYATPGNPLNRPGWHADGFGARDINYIWSDRYPTQFAIGRFTDISTDHVKSADQFEDQIADHILGFNSDLRIVEGEPNMLYRLDPSVIHCTPIITPPGGNRSFFKISLSNDKYNLLGNSHNYEFDYNWKMWDRSEIRNNPAYAGGDSGPQ